MIDSRSIDRAFIGSDDWPSLLMQAGRIDLIQRVQYQLSQAQTILPPYTDYTPKNPIPQEALHYLTIMLNGLYQPALYEWFMTVIAKRYDPQIGVIYLLLDWFAHCPIIEGFWYQPLQRLLGNEGIAVAQTMLADGSFSVGQQTALSIVLNETIAEDITSTETYMAEVAKGLPSGRYLDRLLAIHYPWTAQLTNAFFEYVAPEQNLYRLRYVNRYVYYFHWQVDPLKLESLHDNLIKLNKENLLTTQSPFVKGAYRRLAQSVRSVVHFRRQMVQAIQSGN